MTERQQRPHDTISVYQHFKDTLKERDNRINQRFRDQEKAVKAALAAQQATTKLIMGLCMLVVTAAIVAATFIHRV
jgi:hypothetical protein